jgi:hypothetical protein
MKKGTRRFLIKYAADIHTGSGAPEYRSLEKCMKDKEGGGGKGLKG